MIMVYGELSGIISLDGQTFQVDEQQSHDPSLKPGAVCRCIGGDQAT